MRFVKILALVLGVLLVVVGVVYVSYANIVLWWEGRTVLEQMGQLIRWAKEPALAHKKYCLPETTPIIQDTEPTSPFRDVLGYQLRFVDEQAYVLEMVCKQSFKEPLKLSEGTLKYTSKIEGSGVLVPVGLYSVPATRDIESEPLEGTVVLEYGSSKREVGFAAGALVNRSYTGDMVSSVGGDEALAACGGWGYQCCSQEDEVGEGGVQTGATDCPNSCYETCVMRPRVLFFNTDPVMEATGRTVTIQQQSAEVTFGYEIVPGDYAVTQTAIEYGDGARQELPATAEAVGHRYTCDSFYCEYQARLVASDAQGNTLAASRFNTIRIILVSN